MFKKYLTQNLILTLIIIALGALLFTSAFKEYYNHFIPIAVLASLLINIIGYQLASKNPRAQTQIMLLLVQTFAIRFFSYIALVIVFLKLENSREMRLAFVAVLFVLYLGYTSLEIRGMLKLVKGDNTPTA